MIYKLKQSIKKLVPQWVILGLHFARAFVASVRYGFPARRMKVIAVAGTKGKTTTSNMIARILEGDGKKVAMLSTANFQLGGKKWLNDVKLTTPGPAYVQRFLRQAADEGCEYAVLETSSHGMVQYRYWGIPFELAVITNLTSDHLDYHKTFDNYKRSHHGLVTKRLKTLISNWDDPNTHEMLALPGDFKRVGFTLTEAEAEGVEMVRARGLHAEGESSAFEVVCEDGSYRASLPLPGEFNVQNALGALCVCRALGVGMDSILATLKSVGNIPGRLEEIEEGQDFRVVVDYAHSPESLEKVYGVLRPRAEKKLIAVLGGTGDRDKTYRARGGELAEAFADIVIVTNEDPYSEDPESIIDQVMSGIKHKELGRDLFRISDRREAIDKAFSLAEAGDLVAITGKGCEQFMVCGDKKLPWDDREVARELLRGR